PWGVVFLRSGRFGVPLVGVVLVSVVWVAGLQSEQSKTLILHFKRGHTTSPSPSMENRPDDCELGKTNLPGNDNFGGSLKKPVKCSFRKTKPTLT
uniref:Uncharacterized protein n=1 Tax=Romanomermis culicivorax TaxID=13658 RepID=A0A915KF87_ROMCU